LSAPSAISCANSTTCFAVGDAGAILTTTNGGATWSSQISGTTDALSGITCQSNAACSIVGADGIILSNH
jgi:photosystem II stability/assembly factor-like uncharacterized protein